MSGNEPQTTLGRIAYAANQDAWPPREQYVAWELLTNQAQQGWEKVGAAIADHLRREGNVIGD